MIRHRLGGSFAAACSVCLAAFVVGCGGGTSTNTQATGDCGHVEPCGGDVRGTWKLATACFNLPDAGQTFTSTINGQPCPGVTASSVDYSVQGSLTFDSNATYEETVSLLAATVTLSVPVSCFPGTTCAELSTQLAPDAGTGGSSTSVSCAGTSTCICTFNATTIGDGGTLSTSFSGTGTYSTAGNTLTLTTTTDAGGIAQNSDSYCVAGRELHLIGLTTTMNMGAMGSMSIQSDLVAVKE
jgi:hypothetical protein